MWKIKRKNIIVYVLVLPFSGVVTPESFMEEQESFENRQNGFFCKTVEFCQLDMDK